MPNAATRGQNARRRAAYATDQPADREAAQRQKFAGREPAELASLYGRYAPFVSGLARRVTASPCGAEEVTQEVFVFLWEHPERFDPARGSLGTWLGVVTHSRSVSWVRKEATRKRYEQRQDFGVGQVGASVEEAAVALVVAERVRSAVERLPEEQRLVVELAYFQGLTHREVAAALDIPEGTAKSRLRLALKRVAVTLADDIVEVPA